MTYLDHIQESLQENKKSVTAQNFIFKQQIKNLMSITFNYELTTHYKKIKLAARSYLVTLTLDHQ